MLNLFKKEKHAIVVDDSDTVILLLQKLLKNCGKIHYFKDYIALLQNEHLFKDCGLLILDYNVPIMDGLQFMEYYNSKEYQIPVVFMTAHIEHNTIQNLLSSSKNVIDLYNKPFDFQKICDSYKKYCCN